MRMLVLNAGSGTVTATVFERSLPSGPPLRHERATLVHHSDPAWIEIDDGDRLPVSAGARRAQYEQLLDAVDHTDVRVVGHRVVHGGSLKGHAIIDDTVRGALDDAARFAPLHNPPALELVDIATERIPGADHVACLDTAFHRTIPKPAAVYGGPKEWWELGLRRYGFHGISHRDASRRAATALNRSVKDLHLISVHCGGGVSATAVRDGDSVDTTMGLTPLEGPLMAARSGSVDPGLLIHLLRHSDLDVDAVETTLTKQSGLLGLSGVTGSEPALRERPDDPDAALALAAYVHSLASAVASMLTALDRLDVLVLTGDVLQSDPALRAELCARLSVVGVDLDEIANRAWRATDSESAVSTRGSAVDVVMVTADEEFAIAVLAADAIGIP